jgi:hypothetical protein
MNFTALSRLAFLSVCGLTGLLVSALAASRETSAGSPRLPVLAEARRLAAQFLFNDAHAAYRRAELDPAAAREARFGQALALLNVQPQTAGNIATAARLLDELEQDPGPGDLGVAARYFRARIAHLHQAPPDLEAAAQRYAALHRDHPDHPLGAQALVKLAILRLYDRSDPRDRGELIREWAVAAEKLTDSVARRDLYLVLGGAAQFFALPPETALAHLRAGYALGVEELGARASLLVIMGELARHSGQPAVAATYYRSFLAQFRRDNRVTTVRERLRELEEVLGVGEGTR